MQAISRPGKPCKPLTTRQAVHVSNHGHWADPIQMPHTIELLSYFVQSVGTALIQRNEKKTVEIRSFFIQQNLWDICIDI